MSARAARVGLIALCIAYTSPLRAQPPGGEQQGPVASGYTNLPPPPLIQEKPRSGWAALPIGTYSPETHLGLGAFGSYFFRLPDDIKNERPSSLSIVALYTWRNQLITELLPELYWDGDRSHMWSRLDYRRYPNRLWAIGPDAPDSSEEKYLENRWRWQGRIGHAIRGSLFLYGHFELLSMKLGEKEPGGLLATDSIPGSNGGFNFSIGPGLLWDTRDHSLTPHDGAFYDVVLMSSQPAFGSDFQFTTLVLDLRRYIPIVGDHVLAGNVYFALQDGQAPFYQLPQLGGTDLLRGYFEGRFRDRTLACAQAEYRFPIVWRFGGVAFGGIGGVAHTLRAFNANAPKWTVGGGLRLMINEAERLNLRADVGVGHDTFGFYVNVGEVF